MNDEDEDEEVVYLMAEYIRLGFPVRDEKKFEASTREALKLIRLERRMRADGTLKRIDDETKALRAKYAKESKDKAESGES